MYEQQGRKPYALTRASLLGLAVKTLYAQLIKVTNNSLQFLCYSHSMVAGGLLEMS